MTLCVIVLFPIHNVTLDYTHVHVYIFCDFVFKDLYYKCKIIVKNQAKKICRELVLLRFSPSFTMQVLRDLVPSPGTLVRRPYLPTPETGTPGWRSLGVTGSVWSSPPSPYHRSHGSTVCHAPSTIGPVLVLLLNYNHYPSSPNRSPLIIDLVYKHGWNALYETIKDKIG